MPKTGAVSGSLAAVSPDTPQRSFFSPEHCIRANRHALPAPSEGGGRAVGVVNVNRSTRDTATGEGDVPPPSPSAPLPGGDWPLTHCPGGDRLAAVSPDTPERYCSRPKARPSSQSPLTARPLGRGREEAAERPGGGGDRLLAWKDVFGDTRATGEGDVPPPHPVPGENPPKNPVSSPCTVSGPITTDCPPPL